MGGKNNTNVRASEKNQGGYYPVTSDWRENGGQLFLLQFWEPYNTNVGVKTKVGFCLIRHKYKEASYNKNIEGIQERALWSIVFFAKNIWWDVALKFANKHSMKIQVVSQRSLH